MQSTRETGDRWYPPAEEQSATISSEDEFESWLIAALEWERQRTQKSAAPTAAASSERL